MITTRRPRPLVGALTALVLAAGLVASGSTSSQALNPALGYSGPCVGADALTGTTIVVDFQHLDNPVGTLPNIVRCSPNADPTTNPRNGVEALQDAGFALQGTAQYGLAFICKIESQPSNQTCQQTPPANAYWGYYHANGAGHAWTYSNSGAANRTVIPGGFEGWSFSNGSNPVPGEDPYNPAVGASTPTVTIGVSDLDQKITLGQSTTISWSATNSVSGIADGVTPSATGAGNWTGAKTVPSGSQTITPTAKGTYNYWIKVTASGGQTARAKVQLKVV